LKCRKELYELVQHFSAARLLCDNTTSSLENAKKISLKALEYLKSYKQPQDKQDIKNETARIVKELDNHIKLTSSLSELATVLNDTSCLFLRFAKSDWGDDELKTCKLYVPISICIISRFSYFDTLETSLRQMERLILDRFEGKDSSSLLLESSIVRLVREIVLPERGQGNIEFKLFEDAEVTLTISPPPLNALPNCVVNMKVLFDTLSLDDIMTLWWALLNEEKTCVLSEDTSVLSDVCYCLVSLLYPLKWCHTRIDVVPCSLKSLASVVFSPTPVIFGMHSHQLPVGFSNDNRDDGPVVVDIDKGTLQINKYVESAPMPSWMRSRIQHELIKVCGGSVFRYEHSQVENIRNVFFESLMMILKGMTHFISPNWNSRGEWSECPDLEGFKEHLEVDLDFEPEAASTFCYSTTLRQFFDRMIQTPIDESLWDVLFLMSKTKHQSPPFDCKLGRFFEDTSVLESRDRVYVVVVVVVVCVYLLTHSTTQPHTHPFTQQLQNRTLSRQRGCRGCVDERLYNNQNFFQEDFSS